MLLALILVNVVTQFANPDAGMADLDRQPDSADLALTLIVHMAADFHERSLLALHFGECRHPRCLPSAPIVTLDATTACRSSR
ncbi:hypothetical protein [Ensifer canadensis]